MSNFRLQWQKTEIYRYPRSVARYTMIQHERDKGNPLNKHAYVSFRRFHKIDKVGDLGLKIFPIEVTTENSQQSKITDLFVSALSLSLILRCSEGSLN